jgi:hypothetical protein
VKLREAGVRTYLGVDNVHDLFMPMVDGDIWTEARMLMESTRFYDIDAVAEWACAKPVPLAPNSAGNKAASTPEGEEVPLKRAAGGRRRS